MSAERSFTLPSISQGYPFVLVAIEQGQIALALHGMLIEGASVAQQLRIIVIAIDATVKLAQPTQQNVGLFAAVRIELEILVDE